jgi:hypothetical protein
VDSAGAENLAVADLAANGLSVLLGNGDGTFRNPCSSPRAACATHSRDLNQDGKADATTDSVVVLLNNC